MKVKKKAPAKPKIVWQEVQRREISPYIFVSQREGTFSYAARRWIVQEITTKPVEGTDVFLMRDSVISGKPLYTYDANALVADLIEVTARMNGMLQEALAQAHPEESDEPKKKPHPLATSMAKVSQVIGVLSC